MCWLEHSMQFWASFKLPSLSVTGITNLLCGAFLEARLWKSTWANPSEVQGKGLTWLPKFRPAFIPEVRRAEGSVKGKHLSKDKLVQRLEFQFWINSFVHSHAASKENLPCWNPCWLLTSQLQSIPAPKAGGWLLQAPSSWSTFSLPSAPCLPSTAWAGTGVESNPFTGTGRDIPALQIHIQALGKGHICSILRWSEAAAAGAQLHVETAQMWSSICTGTSAMNPGKPNTGTGPANKW